MLGIPGIPENWHVLHFSDDCEPGLTGTQNEAASRMEYNRENFVTRWGADEDFVSEARSVEEESNPEESVDLTMPQGRPLREALESVDASSLEELVSKRATVMKNVTRFVNKGPFRIALVLEEATGTERCCQERGWKVFLQLSHVVAHTSKRLTDLQRELASFFPRANM